MNNNTASIIMLPVIGAELIIQHKLVNKGNTPVFVRRIVKRFVVGMVLNEVATQIVAATIEDAAEKKAFMATNNSRVFITNIVNA